MSDTEVPTRVPDTPATGDTSILVLRNVPQVLYEDDLKRYFEQFGKVQDIRVPRGRKTQGHTGVAFVMFQYVDVARVVQKTMDNYLLDGHKLSASIIQHEALPPNLFKRPVVRNAKRDYAEKYAMFRPDCKFSSEEARDKFWATQGKKAELCRKAGIDCVVRK